MLSEMSKISFGIVNESDNKAFSDIHGGIDRDFVLLIFYRKMTAHTNIIDTT